MTQVEARAEILGSIRSALEQARRAPDPGSATAERARVGSPPPDPPGASRAVRFQAALESVGGRVWHARDRVQAREQLRTIVAATGASAVACSDSELARALCREPPASVTVHDDGSSTTELLDADLGLTEAQGGIAETGTLVLLSDAERHRRISLLPPVHVALLPVSRIVAGIGEALEKVQADSPAQISRCITFITGPSRTADIELTLVVGVHGPQELHVILLEDEPA